MGNTITIVSRKKFHFRNPDPAVDLMSANLDAAASKNRDKYKDAVFITTGDMQLQQAPDWVNKPLGPDANKNGADKNAQNILTWQHALMDGDIYQVNVVDNAAPTADLSGAAAAQQAEQARASKLAEEAKIKRSSDAKEVVALLTPMTKAQIVEYAEKEHELTLDPAKATKEELIESIQNQILKGEVA
jgi:hypothetical protein